MIQLLGDDCGQKKCPFNCYDRGICLNGNCSCFEGYKGSYCESTFCLNDCSNNGICNNSKCQCYKGYCGKDCSESDCKCRNGGLFVNDSCICPKGFAGNRCQNETCDDLNGCNNQGYCKNKTCHCYSVLIKLNISNIILTTKGWTGSSCLYKECPNNCSNNGICDYTSGNV